MRLPPSRPQGTLAGASLPGVGPSARLCLILGPQSPEPHPWLRRTLPLLSGARKHLREEAGWGSVCSGPGGQLSGPSPGRQVHLALGPACSFGASWVLSGGSIVPTGHHESLGDTGHFLFRGPGSAEVSGDAGRCRERCFLLGLCPGGDFC